MEIVHSIDTPKTLYCQSVRVRDVTPITIVGVATTSRGRGEVFVTSQFVVTRGFPSQSGSNAGHWFCFGVFLNMILNKQSSDRSFDTSWRSCFVTVMSIIETALLMTVVLIYICGLYTTHSYCCHGYNPINEDFSFPAEPRQKTFTHKQTKQTFVRGHLQYCKCPTALRNQFTWKTHVCVLQTNDWFIPSYKNKINVPYPCWN